MPTAPIPQPRSYEFYGMPWATREERFRPHASSPSPIAIPENMRSQTPGMPAYDAGAAVPGGTLPLPEPYNWEGGSAVPNELYAMLADLSSAISNAGPPLPAQGDAQGVANWMLFLYRALTTKGEGCGLDPDDVERTIIRHAAQGPHAVAYYLQEAAMSSDVCAKMLFKRPLENPGSTPPARNVAPPVPGGSHEMPTTGTLVTTKPPPGAKKPFPWGWTLGGVSAAVAVAVGMYFLYKGNKRKRRNPCHCNPTMALAIESDELDEQENPYAGSNAYTSIDGQVLGQSLSPLLRKNPGRRRRRRSRR
jgi:hypothetical protein